MRCSWRPCVFEAAAPARLCAPHLRQWEKRRNLRRLIAEGEAKLLPEHGGATGTVYDMAKRRGRRQARVYASPNRHGATRDPASALAYRIRTALRGAPLGIVTVYDAAGRAIAQMDPVTRRRTPL
jgi:hypothetical protein